MPDLDPRSTALVLIDLQNGIVGMPLVPRSGPEVLATCQALAEKFRAAGAPVVLVRAVPPPEPPQQRVDQPFRMPEGGLPAGWTELAAGLAQPSDILVTKHHWSAFHRTDLDDELRGLGVTSIVLAGIATNFGVEATARRAHELGYETVLVEDGCASLSDELHTLAIRHVLPRITRVARSGEIGFAAA